MAEDYTYDPVAHVAVRADSLEELLTEVQRLRAQVAELSEMQRKVRRAYALYQYNAKFLGVEPLTFAEWFDFVSGEGEELLDSTITESNVLLDKHSR